VDVRGGVSESERNYEPNRDKESEIVLFLFSSVLKRNNEFHCCSSRQDSRQNTSRIMNYPRCEQEPPRDEEIGSLHGPSRLTRVNKRSSLSLRISKG
jgi:hypothetical protein